MKHVFATFLIVSFAGIAVFGFSAMSHSEGSHGSCIAATAQGIICPDAMSALNFASFHLNTFKDFTTAIFSNASLSALLLSIALLLLAGFGVLTAGLNSPGLNFAQRHHLSPTYSSAFKKSLTRWLALHENSPSAF